MIKARLLSLIQFSFMIMLVRAEYSDFHFADSMVAGNNDMIQHMNKESNYLMSKKPHPLRFILKKNIVKRQKMVAAALAFPFPFGIVGLHRIYMGTQPHVPVIYIATFGGAFGTLPFIDFCILLLDKKPERYFNNPRIFMWIEPANHNSTIANPSP